MEAKRNKVHAVTALFDDELSEILTSNYVASVNNAKQAAPPLELTPDVRPWSLPPM